MEAIGESALVPGRMSQMERLERGGGCASRMEDKLGLSDMAHFRLPVVAGWFPAVTVQLLI